MRWLIIFFGVSGSPVLGKGIFLKRLSDCQVPELLLQKAKGDVRTYQSLLAAFREKDPRTKGVWPPKYLPTYFLQARNPWHPRGTQIGPCCFFWNSEAYVAGEWTSGGEYLWSQHDAGWPCWCFPVPKDHHLPTADPEAAVAVAVTVGSFSDPEAAEGKRWGKQVIHWFIAKKNPWVLEKRFLRSQIFLSAFFFGSGSFFCLNGHREKNSAAGVWWLGSFAGAFDVFGFQELSREVPSEERWEGVELGKFFFVEDVFCTNEMDDFHNMKELLSTTYTSYFNWKDSKIKLFFLQSFVEIVWTIEFLQFFFFALGKRSGCFCWLRFLFGRSGFDAWLAQNGGGSNAYTAEEQTVFYASVSGKAVSFWLGV